jgi:hypothetical protein
VVGDDGSTNLTEKIQEYFKDNALLKSLTDWWCYAASKDSINEFHKFLVVWKKIKQVTNLIKDTPNLEFQ